MRGERRAPARVGGRRRPQPQLCGAGRVPDDATALRQGAGGAGAQARARRRRRRLGGARARRRQQRQRAAPVPRAVARVCRAGRAARPAAAADGRRARRRQHRGRAGAARRSAARDDLRQCVRRRQASARARARARAANASLACSRSPVCQSMPCRHATFDVFSSVAATLVRAGVPANKLVLGLVGGPSNGERRRRSRRPFVD